MTRGMNAARKDRVNRVLPAVEAPVLIMRGPYDHISPDRWTRELAAAAPDGQVETLPAGHTWCPSPIPMHWPSASKPFSAMRCRQVAHSSPSAPPRQPELTVVRGNDRKRAGLDRGGATRTLMGLARTWAVALLVVEGHVVEIEADVGGGLPRFQLVGLPDAALHEAKDRTRAAITNSGRTWPNERIVLALFPGEPACTKLSRSVNRAVRRTQYAVRHRRRRRSRTPSGLHPTRRDRAGESLPGRAVAARVASPGGPPSSNRPRSYRRVLDPSAAAGEA
jgi:hypothetical protein